MGPMCSVGLVAVALCEEWISGPARIWRHTDTMDHQRPFECTSELLLRTARPGPYQGATELTLRPRKRPIELLVPR
jgi:hypothetical protein